MRLFKAIAALGLSAVLFVTPACGKKGDPLPPGVAKPSGVSRIDGVKTDSGIALKWQMPGKDGDGGRFRIFRREIEDADCQDCAAEYRIIADIAFSRNAAAGEVCQYNDSSAAPGRRYGYRIAVCGEDGVCSVPSDEVIIRFGSERTGP